MFNSVFGEKLNILIENKKKLFVYYEKLSLNIRNKIDRKQIKTISQDELKHIKMVQSIYARINGNQVPEYSSAQGKKENTARLLDKIIYMEIENIQILKSLILSITDLRIKNGLYYILTDDQRHSDIDIYLFTKYT